MAAARAPRALVAGGSLGGLFVANLLHRAGWDVTVHEQSPVELAGRGAGIISHPDLFRCLERIGIAIDDSFGVRIPERVTFDRAGREIATLPLPQFLTTWGRLYELLRGAFPQERYRFGAALQSVDERRGRVRAAYANGAQAEAELLIGADGIRSTVRAQFAPEARPVYAGYVGWRGLADEALFSERTHRDLFPRFAFCLPEREQMLGYPVAGFTNSTRPGERCYNFVWYRPATEHDALARLCTDVHGRRHDMSVPPPLIRPEVIAQTRSAAEELLSPQFAEVVRHTRQPFFQTIFDVTTPRMTFGRIALLGDAAFVARPHCGMGVTKAAGDAMALADALAACGDDVAIALARYEAARLPFGAAVVRHAQELGAHLQGTGATPEERAAAALHHTPHAAMREIAVTRDFD